jgi:hypothetical protein
LVNALATTERFADGLAAEAELTAAHEAARELEDESAMNEEGNPRTDALYYGALAIREATSPDHPDFHCGTPDMIDHLISAIAYASPSTPKGNREEEVAFFRQVSRTEKKILAEVLRCIFGNPFRPVAFSPEWRTDTALSLAGQMYASRDFAAMSILADALQDAGCDSADILDHCRGSGPHVRGCWCVDLVLEKE